LRVWEKDYEVYFDNHSTLLRIHKDERNKTHGGDFCGKKFFEGNFWGQIFIELKTDFSLLRKVSLRDQKRPCLVKNCHWPQKGQFFLTLIFCLTNFIFKMVFSIHFELERFLLLMFCRKNLRNFLRFSFGFFLNEKGLQVLIDWFSKKSNLKKKIN